MEFTQEQLVYIFNCISERGIDADHSLKDIKQKIAKKPSLFFRSVPTLEATLNELITGYQIQLKMLSEINLEGDQDSVRKRIEKGLKIAVGYKSDLNGILDNFDKDEDE